jgi:hypothetical protein
MSLRKKHVGDIRAARGRPRKRPAMRGLARNLVRSRSRGTQRLVACDENDHRRVM